MWIVEKFTGEMDTCQVCGRFRRMSRRLVFVVGIMRKTVAEVCEDCEVPAPSLGRVDL